MSRHSVQWRFERDWEGNWNSIVRFDYGRQCFVRYTDRDGERVEEIRATNAGRRGIDGLYSPIDGIGYVRIETNWMGRS